MINSTLMNMKRFTKHYYNMFHLVKRNISQSKAKRSLEGKTTATVLNKEANLGILIDGYSEVGFRLNNNFTVIGSMLIFPRSVLSWTVDHVSEISEESLSLFSVLEPKVDILVIGTGDKMDNLSYSKSILNFMKNYKISVEILPTAQACPTFNFLNSEGRYVVGAMIPPKNIEATDDEVIRTKARYQSLYGVEYESIV